MNKTYLEIREVYPDGRASENVDVYIIPVLQEKSTAFVTSAYFTHNLTGCTKTDRLKNQITWRKSTDLRHGDVPCCFTPTFKIAKVLSIRPSPKKHYIFLGEIHEKAETEN